MKCIIVGLDEKSSSAIGDSVKKVQSCELKKVCRTFTEASDILLKTQIDIIFISSALCTEKVTGTLGNLVYERPSVIVVADKKEDAKEAFDFDAIDFVLKPATEERTMKALTKAMKLISNHFIVHNESLFIKTGRQVYEKIDTKDIYMIQGLADYLNIFTPQKRFTIHSTMKSMMSYLNQDDFLQVHKSYIVRVEHISKIDHETLIMQGQVIPIGITYRNRLKERLQIV